MAKTVTISAERLAKLQALADKYDRQTAKAKKKSFQQSEAVAGTTVRVHYERPEDFLSPNERERLLQISNQVEYLRSMHHEIKDKLNTLTKRKFAYFDLIDRRIKKFNQFKTFEERWPQLPVSHPLHSRKEKEKMIESQIEQAKFEQRRLEENLLRMRQADTEEASI